MGRPQGFIFVAGGVAMVFNNTVTGTTYNYPHDPGQSRPIVHGHWRVPDG